MRTPPQILIVDDNSANRDIFETRLAAHGYDVITARDGAEGLAVAMERKPDLILLDIMMPKMDGIEVCRRLKGDLMRTAQGGAVGAKIQHPLTSAFGYKQTWSGPKFMSAFPP